MKKLKGANISDAIIAVVVIALVLLFAVTLSNQGNMPQVKHSVSEDKCISVTYSGDDIWDCDNLPAKYTLIYVK